MIIIYANMFYYIKIYISILIFKCISGIFILYEVSENSFFNIVKEDLFMKSLIDPNNTWLLWTFLAGWATISIYLEKNYKWAAKLTSSIIALLGAIILANLKIIPTESPVYDSVWTYVIPLAIPMLLFECNVKKIWKESGRLLIMFLIGAIGTVIGAFLGYALLQNHIPNLEYVATVMTGSYIGGGVNFVALADAFNVPSEVIATATVADNLLMAIYFFVLLALPTIGFIKKQFNTPLIDNINNSTCQLESESNKEQRSFEVLDIAFTFAISIAIVSASILISDFFANIIPTSNALLSMINALFGNMYLILTTLTMLFATLKSDFFENIIGAQEVGIFLMIIFMVVIGTPASIVEIIKNAPLLLIFCGIMVFTNMIVVLIGAKLLNFNLEEAIIASNANIGGPATAPAMAITQGWTSLVGPSVLVAVFGYIVGNYLGIIVGNILI